MKFPRFDHQIVYLMSVAALLGLCACTEYEDSGQWSGDAVQQGNTTPPSDCSVSANITHTDETILLSDLSTECADRATDWSPGAFDVRGDSVWQNGEQVGQVYADGSVRIEFDHPTLTEYPFPADRVVVTWSKVGDYLHFSEEADFGSTTRTTDAWMHLNIT